MTVELPIGVSLSKVFRVDREHSAKHIGSGEVEVLSTPSMILFMEMVSLELAQRYLPQNLTTVGTRVDVKHLNPAPVGAEIMVESKLVKQEGRKLTFEVRARWKDLVVGEGIHERYIVDKQKFVEKVKRLVSERV